VRSRELSESELRPFIARPNNLATRQKKKGTNDKMKLRKKQIFWRGFFRAFYYHCFGRDLSMGAPKVFQGFSETCEFLHEFLFCKNIKFVSILTIIFFLNQYKKK